MNIKDFLNKNWVYTYTRRMTYQKVRLYHYGYWKGFREVFGYKQSFEIYRFINGDCFNYLVEEETKGLTKYLSQKFIKKTFILKTIKNLPDKIKKWFKNYLDFLKTIPQNFDDYDYSNKEIINILREYYKQDKIVTIGFWILFNNVEESLTISIRKLMESKGTSSDEINKLLIKLSKPMRIIPIDMEKLSLLKIALMDKKRQESALKKHCSEFSYMPMYDVDYKPYNLNYFKKRLNDIKVKLTKGKIKQEINNIRKKYKERYNYYLKVTKRFKSQKDILYLLEFFAAYSYLKDFKPYTRDKGGFYVKNLFKEIGKRLSLTLEQVLSLNEEEIPKMLNGEILIKKEDLNKRINNSAYYCNRDKIRLIINKKELDKIDKALNKKEETKELKGIGVSPGFVKGKVSIILSNNDFNKFKQDEILVTGATRPDFVPLMKKAKGIITDEGGILSHAAIMSRELHKPCVVGTVKATRVLKNGDLVEVDANNGIIKILKRKKIIICL